MPSSSQTGSTGAGPQWSGLEVTPVRPADPAKIGDFWLDGRVDARPSGTAWLGHGDGLTHPSRESAADANQRVILVQLAAGAADDKAARDRFSGLVNRLHIDDVVARGGDEQDQGRLARRFRSDEDDPVGPGDSEPIAPWVALAYNDRPDALAIAQNLLAEVDLLELQPLGQPAGPDFRLHWLDRDDAGRNRTWPLPWPGRYDRAGWVSILASWLLMVALMVVALAIAALLFRNSVPQTPPPAAGTGPATGSPSPSSTSSDSPSPSPSPSESSATPSPEPTESAAGGTPTPPSRL